MTRHFKICDLYFDKKPLKELIPDRSGQYKNPKSQSGILQPNPFSISSTAKKLFLISFICEKPLFLPPTSKRNVSSIKKSPFSGAFTESSVSSVNFFKFGEKGTDAEIMRKSFAIFLMLFPVRAGWTEIRSLSTVVCKF